MYPNYFYDHFDSKTQDIFYKITELTNADLLLLEKKLVELGVIVDKPSFNSVDQFIDEYDNLIKPPITPRDWAITIGNTLFVIPQYLSGVEPYQEHLNRYVKNNQKVVSTLRRLRPPPLPPKPKPRTTSGKPHVLTSETLRNTEKRMLTKLFNKDPLKVTNATINKLINYYKNNETKIRVFKALKAVSPENKKRFQRIINTSKENLRKITEKNRRNT